MRIFSAQQLYEADKQTVKTQNISSAELMERAGKQVFNWVEPRFKNTKRKFHIFCGLGNNGGDGLVIGRYLLQKGYAVRLYSVCFRKQASADFSINLERLRALGYEPEVITGPADFPQLQEEAIVIDAVFGIGLGRPPEAWVAALFQHINTSGAIVISVDIPSGLYMHAVPEDTNAIISASFTLTFQTSKLVFFLPQTGSFAGRWEVLDIGLDTEYLEATPPEAWLVEKLTVLPWYRHRKRFSHKGSYGHALLIGGSYGKMGAVTLASRACITSGAGLVTAYIPECGYTILQTALPEVMTITDSNYKRISEIDFHINPSAIGIGVGMGTEKETQQAFINFIKRNRAPLVIDADGLNILSLNKNALHDLPSKTILTPHPKELERLTGKWKDDFDKIEKVKAFSREYDVVVVVKGAHTLIVADNILYINSTGNPGMATAGSGDVLTGMLTALIAQGYLPLQAAVLGVYLHGYAGDLAAERIGYEALTAGKSIDDIGNAFMELLG